QFLSYLKNLIFLQIQSIHFIDNDIKFLIKLKKLKIFKLKSCSFIGNGLKYLKEIKTLENLDFNECIEFDIIYLSYLISLPNLYELSIKINPYQLQKPLLSILPFLPNLRFLNVSGRLIGDRWINSLPKYPKLTYLNVSYCNKLTDECLIN